MPPNITIYKKEYVLNVTMEKSSDTYFLGDNKKGNRVKINSFLAQEMN
jgi:hypothetical protein